MIGVAVADPVRGRPPSPVAGDGDGDDVDAARRALPGRLPGVGVEGEPLAPIDSDRRPPERFGVDFAAGEGKTGGWTSPLTVATATVWK